MGGEGWRERGGGGGGGVKEEEWRRSGGGGVGVEKLINERIKDVWEKGTGRERGVARNERV